MTDERPASFEAAADLRALLRELGQTEPAARPADAESAREERMAARMAAELEGLVQARRSSRKLLGFSLVAVAAVALVAVGAQHLHTGDGSPSIAQEPIAPGAPKAHPKLEAPSNVPALPQVVPQVTPPRASVPTAASAAPSAEPASTLAEENQLFKASAEASRNGDLGGALSQLDKLLTLHPKSPLAQTAQVRKFRLLAKAGRALDARREAERYLASYPTGFAVSEAQTLLAGGAASEPSAPVQEPAAP
jgi:hypothetical protein